MPKGKGKHLDISDRVLIQECLKEGLSLSKIADKLAVSTSTVSREIKNNRTRYLTKGASKHHDLCIHHATCVVTGLAQGGLHALPRHLWGERLPLRRPLRARGGPRQCLG